MGLVLCLFLLRHVTAHLPPSQIDALQEIYDSLHGNHWSGCQWNMSELAANDSLLRPVICGLMIRLKRPHSDDGFDLIQTVTGINFIHNNLNGTFPDSALKRLPDITEFSIALEPLLVGHFPNVCSLKNLSLLSIMYTNLNGTVPHCMGNISSLEFIIISGMDSANLADIEQNNKNSTIIFDDMIIEMWCNNENNIGVIEFEAIDYRFSFYIFFLTVRSVFALYMFFHFFGAFCSGEHFQNVLETCFTIWRNSVSQICPI